MLPHTIVDALETNSRWRAHEPAIICDEQTVDWREFNAAANRLANALIDRGVSSGARVAVLTENRPEHLIAIFGALKAGAAAVPLSPYLTGDILAGLMADAAVSALVADDSLMEPAKGAVAQLPHGETVQKICIGAPEAGWTNWDAFLSENAAQPAVEIAPDSEAVVIYSSGTTGTPKGIVHTHASRREFAMGLGLVLGLRPHSHGLVTTPLCSNGSWMIFAPCIACGVPVTITKRFSPESFFDAVETNGCTVTFAVPTQSKMILEADDFSRCDFSRFDTLVSSGAALPRALKQALSKNLPGRLIELYGQTEGVATILYPGEVEAHIDTVGRPGAGTDIVILTDYGQVAGAGEIGEIAGWVPSQMTGYLNRPVETREVWWHDAAGRRYIRTGDIGRITKDGYLQILDRKKDMIVSGGFNIFPQDIEAIIRGHPDVRDVAVIGVPDDRWGETPVAIIIANDAQAGSSDELTDWINARVAKTQRVSRVVLRETDFPRNLIGKVLKRSLRDEYATG